MSGIALTNSVSRGNDGNIDIEFVGINYVTNQVIVRLRYTPSNTTRDFTFSQGAGLGQLVANVSQFAGLRVALLQYLQTLAGDLGGGVS